MLLVAGLASKSSLLGQAGHVTPSAALFGSPFLANAPMLAIIALDSCSRPGSLAVLFATLLNKDGPKLPNTNARSNACAAP